MKKFIIIYKKGEFREVESFLFKTNNVYYRNKNGTYYEPINNGFLKENGLDENTIVVTLCQTEYSASGIPFNMLIGSEEHLISMGDSFLNTFKENNEYIEWNKENKHIILKFLGIIVPHYNKRIVVKE